MDKNQEYLQESIGQETANLQILDMTHAEQYSGGVMEHCIPLNMLESNGQPHAHRFPHRDTEKVLFAASLLSTLDTHPDSEQREIKMNDPVEWLRDLQSDSDPYLEDFEDYLEEMQKMYGDKNRNYNVAMK
jgi:hypothetical protein